MRLQRQTVRGYLETSRFKWSIIVPTGLMRILGWQPQDELAASVENGELRVRRIGPRDPSKDRVSSEVDWDGGAPTRPSPPSTREPTTL